jgi:hypothetical protein
MQVTHGPSLVPRAKSNLLALITSLRMQVSGYQNSRQAPLNIILVERKRITGAGGYIEYGRVNGQ